MDHAGLVAQGPQVALRSVRRDTKHAFGHTGDNKKADYPVRVPVLVSGVNAGLHVLVAPMLAALAGSVTSA